MSENKHTNEPWPPFTDIATTMTPDPEGSPVAILSLDDYIRARACVNACAGIDTDQLETGSINKSLQMFALESATYRRQRDELLAALDQILAFRSIGSAHIVARAVIARVKGSSPATCEKCNTPDLCREYGRACDPYELPETSVPAIVFYPAGSLGEEVA